MRTRKELVPGLPKKLTFPSFTELAVRTFLEQRLSCLLCPNNNSTQHTALTMHQTLLEVLYIYWEFPGGPVVRTQRFQCQGQGSNPGWGTKILQAMWNNQKKKKKILYKY